MTPLECEYAASLLELADVTAYPIDRVRKPAGCFWYKGRLYFNEDGDPESEDNQRRALCITQEEEQTHDYMDLIKQYQYPRYKRYHPFVVMFAVSKNFT